MSRSFRRPGLALVGGVTILAGGWIAFGRLPVVADPGDARPARTYEEAVARIDSTRALDGPAVNPLCRSRLLGPGRRTERVLVLLHGFTNCPRQFDSLAAEFSRRGFNVYVPRIVRHGLADRMTPDLSGLTAEELVRTGEDAVDVARGLGDHVTVVGLSSSAVLAAWLAAHRPDVDGAVVIAPAFAPHGVPGPGARRLAGLLLRAPNFFIWWDSKRKDRTPGPPQCYPRFASRALAQIYRLGFAVLDEASRAAPRRARIAVITTADDEGVNNDLADELVRRWRAAGGEARAYRFSPAQGVRHDMIDPEQPYERVAVSYPVIESMVWRLGEH